MGGGGRGVNWTKSKRTAFFSQETFPYNTNENACTQTQTNTDTKHKDTKHGNTNTPSHTTYNTFGKRMHANTHTQEQNTLPVRERVKYRKFFGMKRQIKGAEKENCLKDIASRDNIRRLPTHQVYNTHLPATSCLLIMWKQTRENCVASTPRA